MSHSLVMTSHHFIYGIKSTIYDITYTTSDLMSTVSVSSHPLYQWYHSQYMYDMTSSISVTAYTLYLWHHTQYVWHHNTVCWWHRTQHMYDVICTTDDITSTLSQQITIFMRSHPLQAWHHTPCIRHCTNCIYVITTSPLIITSTFVWHHTHYMCDIICTLYNITSTAYVITLLYLWQHHLYIWNDIQYAVQNMHHPCEITAINLCHHTHCVESIIPTLCMTAHVAYV